MANSAYGRPPVPQVRSPYTIEMCRTIHRVGTSNGIVLIKVLPGDRMFFIMVYEWYDSTANVTVFGEAKMLSSRKKLYWIHDPVQQDLEVSLPELEEDKELIATHLLKYYHPDGLKS